jgi:nitroreductase
MDVFEAVRTLLAVRSYQDKPIPEEVVQRIVESGQLTASSMNKQPWHFVVVDDRDTLRRLGELAKTGPYIPGAALVIAVVIDPANRWAVSDGSRAIQSMMLTAWEAGVGSNWVGFAGALEDIKPVLNVPDNLDILALIPFGYPEANIGRGKKERKPLNEVASRNRFDQPF